MLQFWTILQFIYTTPLFFHWCRCFCFCLILIILIKMPSSIISYFDSSGFKHLFSISVVSISEIICSRDLMKWIGWYTYSILWNKLFGIIYFLYSLQQKGVTSRAYKSIAIELFRIVPSCHLISLPPLKNKLDAKV